MSKELQAKELQAKELQEQTLSELSESDTTKLLYTEEQTTEQTDGNIEWENDIEDSDIQEEQRDTISSEINPADQVRSSTQRQKPFISGRRREISYGGTTKKQKLDAQLRHLESIRLNQRIIKGVVVSGRLVQPVPNQMPECIFEVIPENEVIHDISIWISGDEMTKFLQWDGTEEHRSFIYNMRRRFTKGMVGAEIQFCIKNITVSHSEQDTDYKEFYVSGSRISANAVLQKQYFSEESDDCLQVGDIVNGRITAVFVDRVLFTVAGWDMYLTSRVPYITGMTRFVPGVTGKKLFNINEEKECLLLDIERDVEARQLQKLQVSFYEALKDEILRKTDTMEVGSVHAGTVIRYVAPNENGNVYIVAKTDSGVEVLCDLPNWVVPPMEMDSVKIRIAYIQVNDGYILIRGHLKR